MTRPTWDTTRRDTYVFAYGALTLCGRTFQSSLANVVLCDSSVPPQRHSVAPSTPVGQRLRAITPGRFGLFPVRSPLLGKSRLLSFPRGTEMFHSPRLASTGYVFTRRCWSMTPSGLSHSEIHGSKLVRQLPVAYRSLTASFIASWRQNIHHAPFVAWPPFFLRAAPLAGPVRRKRRLSGSSIYQALSARTDPSVRIRTLGTCHSPLFRFHRVAAGPVPAQRRGPCTPRDARPAVRRVSKSL